MLQGLHNNLSLFQNLSWENEDQSDVEEPVADLSDQMSWPNLLWTISFTIIVVVGTLGNAIVLWIILGMLLQCLMAIQFRGRSLTFCLVLFSSLEI